MAARTDVVRGPDSSPWKSVACIVAVFAFASLLATCSSLWDRDEPRFARAAVEMASSGQWLYPTFNGELRPDKPILVYWLMALSVRSFGASEWAVRSWSPIALAASAWLVWSIARRFLSPSAARLAVLVLATAPLALAEGTVATTDAVLLACITAALACFVALAHEGPRTSRFVLLALTLGAAQLAKGPVGIAVPLFVMLAAIWMLRSKPVFERGFLPRLGVAALASIALFCAWAVPANSATGGEFARRGLGHHVAGRVLQPLEGHGGSYVAGLFFYVPVVLLGVGPWVMQLPAGLVALASGRLGTPTLRALLVAWIGVPFVFMSLVATKLPHYVLPIFPALAIAVAAAIDAAEHGALAARDLAWMRHGAWLYAAIVVLEVAALGFASTRPEVELLRGPLAALAFTVFIGGLAAIVLQLRGRWRSAAGANVLATVATLLVLALFALPEVERVKLAPRMAEAIRGATAESVPIATFGFDEPSLNFYCGRGPIARLDDAAQVLAWEALPRDGVLVLPRERLVALASKDAPPLEEIASVQGFNYSKGRAVELVALRRRAR